jgi:hypothetical protein
MTDEAQMFMWVFISTFIVPLAAMLLVSWLLILFVAPNARPLQRAAWITGLAYLIVSSRYVFASLDGSEIAARILASIPMGLIIFWYWYGDFRRHWIEEPVADDAKLENNNWIIGLITVIAIITVVGTIMSLTNTMWILNI